MVGEWGKFSSVNREDKKALKEGSEEKTRRGMGALKSGPVWRTP